MGISMRWFCFSLFVTLALVASIPPAEAELLEYYIGRDLRTTIPTGTHAGLDNPNFNRVTFLYAHTYPLTPDINHYHSKGTYSYTGPNLGAATAVNDFNGTFGVSNLLPESPAFNNIYMHPGSGVFSNKLVTGIDTTSDFNNLRIRSVDTLTGFAPLSGENYLHISSGGRFAGSMVNSNILMELVSIDPGLGVFDSSGNNLFPSVGSQLNLGNGSIIDFTPIFAVDITAIPGQDFNAVFRLHDTGTGNNGAAWLSSGRFQYQVTAIPEPSSIAMLGMLGAGVCLHRRRTAQTREA